MNSKARAMNDGNPLPGWAVLLVKFLLQLLANYGCPLAEAFMEVTDRRDPPVNTPAE